MAFAKSVKDILPSFGSPTTTVQRSNVTTNVGATTVTLPASGNFQPTISTGRIRVKSLTIGANATFIITGITGTDGTTTISLYGGDTAASAAGVGIDRQVSFRCDLNLTSVSVVITVATTNSTCDVEIAGNP